MEQRIAARFILADLPLAIFLDEAVVPYEHDEITRLIIDQHDAMAFSPIAHHTVGSFRDWLLANETDGARIAAVAHGARRRTCAVSRSRGPKLPIEGLASIWPCWPKPMRRRARSAAARLAAT